MIWIDLMKVSSVGTEFSPNWLAVTGVAAMASRVFKESSPISLPKMT